MEITKKKVSWARLTSQVCCQRVPDNVKSYNTKHGTQVVICLQQTHKGAHSTMSDPFLLFQACLTNFLNVAAFK